jgi:hypothetical protein
LGGGMQLTRGGGGRRPVVLGSWVAAGLGHRRVWAQGHLRAGVEPRRAGPEEETAGGIGGRWAPGRNRGRGENGGERS